MNNPRRQAHAGGPPTEAELRDALTRTSGRSDMLPPREVDKIAGRIASGFARELATKLGSDSYRPQQAMFVAVPKRSLSTRPAAIVALRDAVVLDAYVERTRAKIERRLLPSQLVLWPRGDDTGPRFNDLEAGPSEKGGGYIVFGDVAGFYESVLHPQLRICLAGAGVATENIDAIINQLGAIMGGNRGLPQGVRSSDYLATLYLAAVDAHLSEAGVQFWRHGDDYRIWAADWPQVSWSAHAFEAALRDSGLLSNSSKLRAVKFSKYMAQLRDVDTATATFRANLEKARLWALENMTEEQLSELAVDLEVDEDVQWSYFYHNAMSFEGLKKEIAPALAPKTIDIIEEMFRDVVSPESSVPSELRHARLVYCLRRLAAVKSDVGLDHAASLLVNWPDETREICGYLVSVVDQNRSAVAAAAQSALAGSRYMTDWQMAWILRVLSRCSAELSAGALEYFAQRVQLSSTGWLSRIEMARVLATRGVLTRAVASMLAASCGDALRADVIGLIAANERRLEWATSFLGAVTANDDLMRVVVSGVRENASKGKA